MFRRSEIPAGTPPTRAPAGRPSALELVYVSIGMIVFIAIEIGASGSWSLITSPPWLDECLTLLVVNDPSFQHGLAAIRGGVENTPPAFFMMMWPVARLAGGFTPVELRLLDGLFIPLAGAAVYGTSSVPLRSPR